MVNELFKVHAVLEYKPLVLAGYLKVDDIFHKRKTKETMAAFEVTLAVE